MWVICFQDFLQALWEVDFARAMKTLFVRPPSRSPSLSHLKEIFIPSSRLSGSISLSSLPSRYSPVCRETIPSLFEFSATWWNERISNAWRDLFEGLVRRVWFFLGPLLSSCHLEILISTLNLDQVIIVRFYTFDSLRHFARNIWKFQRQSLKEDQVYVFISELF